MAVANLDLSGLFARPEQTSEPQDNLRPTPKLNLDLSKLLPEAGRGHQFFLLQEPSQESDTPFTGVKPSEEVINVSSTSVGEKRITPEAVKPEAIIAKMASLEQDNKPNLTTEAKPKPSTDFAKVDFTKLLKEEYIRQGKAHSEHVRAYAKELGIETAVIDEACKLIANGEFWQGYAVFRRCECETKDKELKAVYNKVEAELWRLAQQLKRSFFALGSSDESMSE